MQTRQRIFNCTDIQVCTFLSQNAETFDISDAFLPLTVAKWSTLKNSPVFAHPVYVNPVLNSSLTSPQLITTLACSYYLS